LICKEIAKPSLGLENPEVQGDREREREFGEIFAIFGDRPKYRSPRGLRETLENKSFL
jgi:hypothetical protein